MKNLNFKKKIKVIMILNLALSFSLVSAEDVDQAEKVVTSPVGEYTNIYNDDGTVMERVFVSIPKPKNLVSPIWDGERWIECHECINTNNKINQENISELFPEVNTQTHPLELNSGAHATIGGVWTNASSRALKENIINIDDKTGLDTVLNLQPVTYNYKVQPGETYAGFIAEDVPKLVATSSRTSLSPMDIVSVVVGAIKEIWNKLNSILDRLSVIEEKLGIENKQEVVISNEDVEENNSEEIIETENIEDKSTEGTSAEEDVNLEENSNTQENIETLSENIEENVVVEEEVEENQSEEEQNSEEIIETEKTISLEFKKLSGEKKIKLDFYNDEYIWKTKIEKTLGIKDGKVEFPISEISEKLKNNINYRIEITVDTEYIKSIEKVFTNLKN